MGLQQGDLGFAGEYHLRKAKKAGVMRGHYVATRCAHIMTFEQFRQEGVRNRIRRELGFDPIYIPTKRGPKARGNEAQPRRSSRSAA